MKDLAHLPAEARHWIETLSLLPHPEGGWYAESYRAGTMVDTPAGPRPAATAIYFLLAGDAVSHLHRIASDELWHFYAGGPMTVHVLDSADEESVYRSLPLGPGRFQQLVPAGVWFGASLDPGTDFCLVGCTVAPGFDFADFELGTRERLLELFPQQAELVKRLTWG